MCIKLKSNTEEVLLGKFRETIAKIEGVYKEAKGDMEIGTIYKPQAVFYRVESIKESFYADLKKLAADIEIE